MGGIWAQVDLRHQYDEEQKGKRSPFWIDSLKPIQLASSTWTNTAAAAREFTTEEWIDLLLRSIGMEPSHFDRRLKLLFLTRLLPLCEHNYNLVELGPRGTGKSYAYQELSPYTILLTGPTTVANLFYNMATGKMGLVGSGTPWLRRSGRPPEDAQGGRHDAQDLLRVRHSPVARSLCPGWLPSPCSATPTSRSR
jgi:ATP-dependent Lon protease